MTNEQKLREAPECHQPDLVTADRVPEHSGRIREITEADMANIVAHLSYECEPTGPLPNANSLMMEIVRLRNELAALDLTPAPAVEPVAWMYELATIRDAETGEYSGWGGLRVTQNKPCVSEGSIRDLTPLYAHPPTPTAQDAARVPEIAALIEAVKAIENMLPVSVVRCNGDKCREAWCASCWGEDEAEAGLTKAMQKSEALAAALRAIGGDA